MSGVTGSRRIGPRRFLSVSATLGFDEGLRQRLASAPLPDEIDEVRQPAPFGVEFGLQGGRRFVVRSQGAMGPAGRDRFFETRFRAGSHLPHGDRSEAIRSATAQSLFLLLAPLPRGRWKMVHRAPLNASWVFGSLTFAVSGICRRMWGRTRKRPAGICFSSNARCAQLFCPAPLHRSHPNCAAQDPEQSRNRTTVHRVTVPRDERPVGQIAHRGMTSSGRVLGGLAVPLPRCL